MCALAFGARVLGPTGAHAQNTTPRSTTPAAAESPAPKQSATEIPTPSPTPTPINWSTDPILKRFVWRGIGPASMGGRIDDISVVESNPYIIYVGFATGGVWKSTNNGTTFQPIFDTYSTASIGDVEVSQSDPNIVWVGTGETNNRQSSSFGDGIYKSTDAGATFKKMGLEDSQTIARIVMDPKNPNIVFVAVLGHLFSPNKERGIYKTTDGGKTWSNINFINEDTGFTDLIMDPSDNKTLYAASYQRRRTSWGFNGGGPGSAIWNTTDAGRTWKKIEGNGLPDGMLGRIGLDISRSNPNIIYAQIEVGPRQVAAAEEQAISQRVITPNPSGSPSPSPVAAANPTANPKESGVWRSDDKGKSWRVVSNQNDRPMYFSQIRVDPKNAENVYVAGINFSRSTDGGKTFKSLSGIPHPDHHAIWIDPNNPKHIILGNDGGLNVSYDQGETWEYLNTIPSAQFYAVAADLRKPYYVYGGLQDNGTWGVPSRTRHPDGITNADWFQTVYGDGFYVQIDPTDYATVYGESQDGKLVRLDLSNGLTVNIRPLGNPSGRGSPMQRSAQSIPKDEPTSATLPAPLAMAERQLVGVQTVEADRLPRSVQGTLNAPGGTNVIPPPAAGEDYRFNWNTPLAISPHNPRILYAGGNRLFKSLNRGDTWTASADLTKHIDRSTLPIMGVSGREPMLSKNDGVYSYGSVVTLAESPKVPGVVWVGTDDGNVQVSRDGGATWNNVSENVPGIGDKYHISRVEPSHFDGATCYLAVDGHRFDDPKPYAFVTRDYGATWLPIANNLPPVGNVNVIREDPVNKELLYVGTEYGLFVSLSGGSQWQRFMSGMPTTRVDDILVHPRDNDLIVGTHGRGIFILDDVTPLQQLSIKVVDSDAYLFEVRPATLWLRDMRLNRAPMGARTFRGANPPEGTAISYYLKSSPAGDVKIEISDYRGRTVSTIVGTKNSGINRIQWNMRGNPPPPPATFSGVRTLSSDFVNQGPLLEAGTYLVRLLVGGKAYTTKVVIEADTPLSQ
jgi:photosystem II stability/assembly factor-like uncharacterized protein